jgi:hypothetical protein
MHLAKRRSRTLGGLAALFAAVVAVLAFSAGGAAAASHGHKSGGTTIASQPTTISRLNNFTQLPHGIQPNLAFLACQGLTELTPVGACTLTPPAEQGDNPGSPSGAPNVYGSHMNRSSGKLRSNFDGISDVLQRTQTGYHFTPPDQGLCVGPAGPLEAAGVPLGVPGRTTVVVELVNDGWGVYTEHGSLLFLDSNIDLFGDPYSSGDIECNYDEASHTYFFTEIGALNGLFYGTNLVVMNYRGYSAYYVDTAEGGYCFPDFPHQGYDNNALYITINEFCGPNEDYAGVNIYALSKRQLAKQQAPNGVYWTLGDSYYSFRAATGNGTNTEYLLASEQNDDTQNALDFAQVTGDYRLTHGNGPIFLSLTSIPSESYSEPVPALSTGDGTTCVYTLHTDPGMPDDVTWCSIPEASLDTVDMRLEQVQYDHGQLYTSLSTAMTVGKDPTVVDGAAWFQVDTRWPRVVRQGYVGVAGTYLLMPSFVKSSSGTFMMGFSMTSPTMNPSTGYVTSKNYGHSFSPVTTTGAGSGPHVSFSTLEPGYMRARWGDYSRIAIDPSDGNVWMADEYIPSGPDGADLVDNWGTRVWNLSR